MNINDITLTLEHGLGSKGAARLIEVFGSAEAVYDATPEELVRRAELRPALAAQIASRETHRLAEREMAHIERHNLVAIAATDPEYPQLLREIPDPPHVIYVDGDPAALSRNCISMVGTRRLSTYGQTMCDRLVGQLAGLIPDLCVVSGLAFGIDANCHRAALRYGIPTVAVVANSLPGVTPAQHSDLAREIVARGGAIVSELHSASKQTGDFYIPRNRIIAALAEGTVVVEAAGGSGALSTADMALGYNRVLMAVPGRATDSAAWGTNLLIKSEKAVMVCSGDDVVRALGWDLRNVAGADLDGTDFGTAGHAAASGGVALLRPGWLRSAAAKAANSRETGGLSAATGGLSDAATGLLKCFVGGDATSVDSLIELTALVYSELAPLLLELEFAGRIRRLPGGSYEKVG